MLIISSINNCKEYIKIFISNTSFCTTKKNKKTKKDTNFIDFL